MNRYFSSLNLCLMFLRKANLEKQLGRIVGNNRHEFIAQANARILSWCAMTSAKGETGVLTQLARMPSQASVITTALANS
jgi:hypothetical protein